MKKGHDSKFKSPISNERGAVLVMGLLLVLVLTILTMGAMMSTGTELRIVANDRSIKEAFQYAEAGLEDARSRMQATSAYPITDSMTSNANWTVFIGPADKAQEKGYQSSNPNHALYDKLNLANMNYVVTVQHKLDGSNNVLKWGDANNDGRAEENTTTGRNIYVITSEGYTSTGAKKNVRIEATPTQPLGVNAALYTKAHTTIQGTSTYIKGEDPCQGVNVAGIITMEDIRTNGNPHITGSPATIENSPTDLPIQDWVNFYKDSANDSRTVNSATLTGMDWGTPTPGQSQQDVSNCSLHNIVYINTQDTYVKLTGGSHGCGMLLVQGDLALHGGFQWYGVVLVTGSITMTGGGGKNITGAVLSGGTVSADLVGGDANILYCSRAVDDQTANRPLITLRWVELFS